MLDKVGATLGKWEQTGITGKLYEQIRGKYDMAINQYNEACAECNRQLNAYNAGLQQYQNAVARLDQGSQAYRSNADNLAQASKQIAEKQNELGKAVSQAGKQVADGVTQLIQGQRDIDKAETEYQSKLAEFNAQKPEAERKISEAERQITLAEEKIDNLTVPAYSVSGRREGLTSQGYCVYMVIEGIVAKLADIFPIFLYFVAALVTFSTMGRMVDEERTNSGTLKALGYGNADVMLKFTVYGFAASTLGTCIGVLAGHTLLPLIVAHAYSAGFTMPDIMLKFHPWITMAAFALAWISAVVPAWLAASKELREKPASLLLPKPPAKGSKILLEHFPPLWNRLNFTHKVTARNIFRYKTRMFMTIFGVCGAVSLLTAGLAVQSSIGQIGNRQFEELIHYDLIVAEESDTNSAQREEIATTLKGKTVQSSTAVRYEELSKTAGKENDKQSITLLSTDDAYNFNEYLTLRDRKTHQPQILVNNGAVISERLAEMLNVSVGDTFTVNDENGAQRTIKVAGISESLIVESHYLIVIYFLHVSSFHGFHHRIIAVHAMADRVHKRSHRVGFLIFQVIVQLFLCGLERFGILAVSSHLEIDQLEESFHIFYSRFARKTFTEQRQRGRYGSRATCQHLIQLDSIEVAQATHVHERIHHRLVGSILSGEDTTRTESTHQDFV